MGRESVRRVGAKLPDPVGADHDGQKEVEEERELPLTALQRDRVTEKASHFRKVWPETGGMLPLGGAGRAIAPETAARVDEIEREPVVADLRLERELPLETSLIRGRDECCQRDSGAAGSTPSMPDAVAEMSVLNHEFAVP